MSRVRLGKSLGFPLRIPDAESSFIAAEIGGSAGRLRPPTRIGPPSGRGRLAHEFNNFGIVYLRNLGKIELKEPRKLRHFQEPHTLTHNSMIG
jgi:hypothetical protein